MKNAFQTRILAVVLAAVTVAACVLAGLNLSSEAGYNVPTDGIWWTEAPGGLCASQVPAGVPGLPPAPPPPPPPLLPPPPHARQLMNEEFRKHLLAVQNAHDMAT